MNKLLKWNLTLFLVLLGIGIMKGSSETCLLEEGKTWWYSYYFPDKQSDLDEPLYSIWNEGIFGLTIAGTEEKNGDLWHRCMVVSKDGVPMLDFPIAWLRDEETKVYVWPHIISESEWEPISSLPDFFSDVYRLFLDMNSPHRACPQYRQDIDGAVLLYDWEMIPKQQFEYPWHFKWSDFQPMIVQGYTNDDNLEGWTATWAWGGEFLIIKGIGAVAKGHKHVGTFLYPCCYSYMATGIPTTTDDVYLLKVTDKDGKIIYNPDPAGILGITPDKNLDGAIYDLCGRRVANPQTGTVYIRDGRKYVAR